MLGFANLVRRIDPESASWAYRGWAAYHNLDKVVAQRRGCQDETTAWRVPLDANPRSIDAQIGLGLALGTPELHGPLAVLAGDRVPADVDPQAPHSRRTLQHGSPHGIKANG